MSGPKSLTKVVVFSLLLANFGFAPGVKAQFSATNTDPGFDPNYILTDDDMFNVYGMNYEYLKHFLQSKGTLADHMLKDIDGTDKPAVDIIWRVAQSYKINPKYLIALIQKEQSLVEDVDPSQNQLNWAAGFAVCDSCDKNDPSLQQFKGFASQLEWAAKQHREKYLLQLLAFGATVSGKAVGKSMDIDGLTVTPGNNATAMLYTYTPHLHGNYNLWKIWQRWFTLAYPNGTIVRGLPSQKAYLIADGQKREFSDEAVILSMTDPQKILETSDTSLVAYPEGDPVRFAKYSIIHTDKDHLYLITSGGKRLIANQKTFRKFGFMQDDVVEATEADVKDYATLNPITEKTAFPQGALVKATKSSTVWYVENSVKHALPDEIFIKLYFPSRPIKTVAVKTLESYSLGDPYTFQDGELIRSRSTSAVYVVEAKKLRPIPSAEIFESMGYKWQNVVMIPDRVLTAYTIDQPLTLTASIPTSTRLVLNQN